MHTHTERDRDRQSDRDIGRQRERERLETAGSVRSKRQRKGVLSCDQQKTKLEHVAQRKGDCSRQMDQ